MKENSVWLWEDEALSEKHISLFDDLMIKFMKANKTWLDWHRNVCAGLKVSSNDVYLDERSVGIDYMKAMQSGS